MATFDRDTENLSGVILVDTTSPVDEAFDVSFLERNDHRVLVCHGPAPGKECPLLCGEECELFSKAHGIMFQLDLDLPEHVAILERYQDLRPDMPIRLVVRPDQAERYRDVLAGFEVLMHEPSAADLDGFAAEVEAADRMFEP
jgi:hypothetical protein